MTYLPMRQETFATVLASAGRSRASAVLDRACAEIEARIGLGVRRYNIDRLKVGAREFIADPWRLWRLFGDQPVSEDLLRKAKAQIAGLMQCARAGREVDVSRLIGLRQAALYLRWARRFDRLEGQS